MKLHLNQPRNWSIFCHSPRRLFRFIGGVIILFCFVGTSGFAQSSTKKANVNTKKTIIQDHTAPPQTPLKKIEKKETTQSKTLTPSSTLMVKNKVPIKAPKTNVVQQHPELQTMQNFQGQALKDYCQNLVDNPTTKPAVKTHAQAVLDKLNRSQ